MFSRIVPWIVLVAVVLRKTTLVSSGPAATDGSKWITFNHCFLLKRDSYKDWFATLILFLKFYFISRLLLCFFRNIRFLNFVASFNICCFPSALKCYGGTKNEAQMQQFSKDLHQANGAD